MGEQRATGRHTAIYRAYLEFLRNHTPQVLFATIIWLQAIRIDFQRWALGSLEAWLRTAGFYFALAVLLASLWANAVLFLDTLEPIFSSTAFPQEGRRTRSLRLALSLGLLLVVACVIEVALAAVFATSLWQAARLVPR